MRELAAALAVVVLLGPAPVSAQRDHDHGGEAPARLLAGMPQVHHPIATKSREAQRWFDQGLGLVYAFNHPEAIRSFREAARHDPRATMPAWGIAYALGPNINMGIDAKGEEAAWKALQHARKLARHAPARERAYVDALAHRYSDDPKADRPALHAAFAKAMGALSRRYPDDLDAAVLYAEAMMNLRPWKLWNADGTPAEGTQEIVATLEEVLRREPDHVGANHYYIHAVEASPTPERALPSASRLAWLAPGAGHLVHMPSHVYQRTGDFAASAVANERAVAADRAYLAGRDGGMYGLMYFTHNIHFLAHAEMMAGRADASANAADELMAAMPADLAALSPGDIAMLDVFRATPLFAALRFGRFDRVLGLSPPDERYRVGRALHHYGRGVAHAARGDRRAARTERDAFAAARAAVPADVSFGYNHAAAVLDVAAAVLDARIAAGERHRDETIAAWRRAVVAQDALSYNEPSDWYYPVRESLGAALLRAGKAAEAEAVFRDDLVRNPRNPRSLHGLAESLGAQRKADAAETVRREFTRAWRGETPPPLAVF
jgi:tetratricopeptide (TPR) repeat protein